VSLYTGESLAKKTFFTKGRKRGMDEDWMVAMRMEVDLLKRLTHVGFEACPHLPKPLLLAASFLGDPNLS
jgi:hypothetical protein